MATTKVKKKAKVNNPFSVGSTPRSRAISFIIALAKHVVQLRCQRVKPLSIDLQKKDLSLAVIVWSVLVMHLVGLART